MGQLPPIIRILTGLNGGVIDQHMSRSDEVLLKFSNFLACLGLAWEENILISANFPRL